MKTTYLFFGVVSGGRVTGATAIAVGVVVGAGVRVVPSISAWRAAASSPASSGFSVLDVKGLFLALSKPDGVDVGVGVLGFEGRGEGR